MRRPGGWSFAFPVYTKPVWGTRPLLGYFALTQSLSGVMQKQAGLTAAQYHAVEQIAMQETAILEALRRESQVIVRAPWLSLEQKRARIEAIGYNDRLYATLRASDLDLKHALGPLAYPRLVAWVERRWEIERILHGRPVIAAGARTFEIYATRYDSKGKYYVALPDQCVKFTNGGLHTCDDKGYKVGKSYDVYLTYTKSVAVRVGESGPWNIDDTYWASASDPTPRRMFADLAVGVPEAQAAYFNGYNGGQDQYGRKVTAPFGIDLAVEVSTDIGLAKGKNDWIMVSYLWTGDWGAAPASAGPAPGFGPYPTETLAIHPVQTVTPGPDGAIIHIVQPGESLWAIAATYKMTVPQLSALNKLTENSVINPGDQLIIRPASTPLTPTSSSTPPPGTPKPTSTRRPTRTPVPHPTTELALGEAPQTLAVTQAASQPAARSASSPAIIAGLQRFDPVLALIVLFLGGGAVLLVVGLFLNRRG